MSTSQPHEGKVLPLRTALVAVAIILSTATILPLVSNNSAMAQEFEQPVRVNVDKSNYVLGDYGLIVINRDTGETVKNYYTDSESSPQNIYVDGNIASNSGDTLVACIMNMVTEEMACDTQTAYFTDDATEFFVDMSYATRVSD
jgi:hypothetical protein